jgi:imidazole glycerol phosphate synthase glutamine amidotransferase subunit
MADGPRIALVDYGAGNVGSVCKAAEHLGFVVQITADPDVVRAADHVLFPGQGHFGQAMQRLRETGLDRVLRQVVEAGKPFTGICLGLQLLFESSDEAPGVPGLGLLRGTNVAFRAPQKVPQIGWNDVKIMRSGSPLDALPDGTHFYFVHSFHAVPTDRTVVVAEADYGAPFVAAVQHQNLFAAQFHPEKSGDAGLRLLAARLGAPC